MVGCVIGRAIISSCKLAALQLGDSRGAALNPMLLWNLPVPPMPPVPMTALFLYVALRETKLRSTAPCTPNTVCLLLARIQCRP